MFLENFYPLSAHYVSGAKKITIRSFIPKIVEGNLQLKFEKDKGNFDLYFNVEGLLTQSEYIDLLKYGKKNYSYNAKKRPVCVEAFDRLKNELLFRTEFVYDTKGRIKKESCYVFYFNECTGVSELKHTYSEDIETISESTNPQDDYTNIVIITYDEKRRPIEEKSINTHKKDCYWYKNEYDGNNHLIKRYILDKTGQTTCIHDYKPDDEKGARPSYTKISQDKDFVKEGIFTYNEKGHWISQLFMLNNEPFYYYERTIEYFHLTLFD